MALMIGMNLKKSLAFGIEKAQLMRSITHLLYLIYLQYRLYALLKFIPQGVSDEVAVKGRFSKAY